MIYIKANSRAATATIDDPLTTGSVGIEVSFDLSEDWEGLARTAVFHSGNTEVDVFLTDTNCNVPPECLLTEGNILRIGVYGTDGQGNLVIPTVYVDVGIVELGTVPSGIDPEVYTPEFSDQLMAAVTEAVDTAREANANSEAAVERADQALEEAGETLEAATEAKNAAQASAAAALVSENNAATSAINAAQSADRAEQAAQDAGYMFFEIDSNGHVIYNRTENVDVDFEIENGRLMLYA